MPAVPARKGRRTKNEINMVPFIDVMLVLLIIFMVTAPLISPSVIDLPSVDGVAGVHAAERILPRTPCTRCRQDLHIGTLLHHLVVSP